MITIVRPIVDSEGTFQPDYEIVLAPQNQIVQRSIVDLSDYLDANRAMRIPLQPQISAPRLAEAIGQNMQTLGSQRGDGYGHEQEYIDYRIPCGQYTYDQILAAEILREVAPDLFSADYEPVFYCDPSNQRIVTDIKWKHKSIDNTFLVLSHEGTRDMHEDQERVSKYLQIKDKKPDSAFSALYAFGLLPFLRKKSAPLGDEDNITYRLFCDVLAGDRLVLHQDKTSRRIAAQGTKRDYSVIPKGVVVCNPTFPVLQHGAELRNALEQFIADHHKELEVLYKTMQELLYAIPKNPFEQRTYKYPAAQQIAEENNIVLENMVEKHLKKMSDEIHNVREFPLLNFAR